MLYSSPASMRYETLKNYLGSEVVSPYGEHLGDLWNFAIDEATGELAYALFKAGDKCYAFLWDEFHLHEDGVLEIMMTADLLQQMPGLDPGECPPWKGHPVRLLCESSIT